MSRLSAGARICFLISIAATFLSRPEADPEDHVTKLTDENSPTPEMQRADSKESPERRLPTILSLCSILLLFALALVTAQNLVQGKLSGRYWHKMNEATC